MDTRPDGYQQWLPLMKRLEWVALPNPLQQPMLLQLRKRRRNHLEDLLLPMAWVRALL